VQVFDFGVTDDGLPYLVMEYLEGETLEKRIEREGRLSIETTFALLRQAARALDRAHALGIVHRDFKPENIIIHADEEGGEQVKVVDFGIAKILGELELTGVGSPSAGLVPIEASSSVTNTAVGTPYYMSPEQVQDVSRLGPAADIWAFGIVAYECLTGRKPYDDESVPQLLSRLVDGAPPVPASTRAPVPSKFDEWFKVACAREPEARFPDAYAAVSALAVALDMPAMPASSFRTSMPGGTPTPQRVVSPLAATLDPRKSARPPRPPLSSEMLGVESLPPLPPVPMSEPAFDALRMPSERASGEKVPLSTPALHDAPRSPPKVPTYAPIERTSRLSLAGRAPRTPLGAVLLVGVFALLATTVTSARRAGLSLLSSRGPASGQGTDALVLAAPSAHATAAWSAGPASADPALPASAAAMSPPATAANERPGSTVASGSAPALTAAAAAGESNPRARKRRAPPVKNAAPVKPAPSAFRLPPLGI
jgi:serine/threonine-protein kinase